MDLSHGNVGVECADSVIAGVGRLFEKCLSLLVVLGTGHAATIAAYKATALP